MTKSNPITSQMTPEQLRKFLSEPHLLDLATITSEGYPHVTPVWFEYDGKNFRISTTRERKKARNLATNPRAGFSIAEHQLPYKAVIGYGEATIEDDTDGKLLERLAHRYLPKEKAGKYFQELMEAGGSRIIIMIKPKWLLSWTGE